MPISQLSVRNPACLKTFNKKTERFQAHAWRPDQEPAMKYKEASDKTCKYSNPTGTFHPFHCKYHFYLVGFHAYLLKYNGCQLATVAGNQYPAIQRYKKVSHIWMIFKLQTNFFYRYPAFFQKRESVRTSPRKNVILKKSFYQIL